MAFRRARRTVSRAAAATLLISTVAVGMTVSAPHALAAGTVLFNQPFHDNTVDGPAGSVSLPASPTGVNAACLSAAGNATANPLASCTSATDLQGSGKLRLTPNATTQEGGVFASTSVPTSQGLDINFNSYQYGGNGADGIAFVLAAVNPANPQIPTTLGQSGGALGYSAKNATTPGLTDGYLGVGIDTYGNFSNKYEGTGCTDPANIAQQMTGQVVVRGPGNGTVGYCALQSSDLASAGPAVHGARRLGGAGGGGLQPELGHGDDTVRAGRAERRLRRPFHRGGRRGEERDRRAAGGPVRALPGQLGYRERVSQAAGVRLGGVHRCVYRLSRDR
jgi:hypothetical protein